METGKERKQSLHGLWYDIKHLMKDLVFSKQKRNSELEITFQKLAVEESTLTLKHWDLL